MRVLCGGYIIASASSTDKDCSVSCGSVGSVPVGEEGVTHHKTPVEPRKASFSAVAAMVTAASCRSVHRLAKRVAPCTISK